MMIRSCLAAACLFFCSTLMAQTTAFGISLGQSTLQDLQNEYTLEALGDSDVTGGPIYKVSGDQINFDQLNYVEIVFDEESRAVGVMATFPPTKFDYLKALLSEQYEQVSDQAFGNVYRIITFEDGGSRIDLDAPAGEAVAVVYLSSSFIASIKADEAARIKEQEEMERQLEEENKKLLEVMEQEKALL